MELKLKSELSNDILDNISPACEAILIEGDFYIEICKGYFFISDGWAGKSFRSIIEALKYLEQFKKDNQ